MHKHLNMIPCMRKGKIPLSANVIKLFIKLQPHVFWTWQSTTYNTTYTKRTAKTHIKQEKNQAPIDFCHSIFPNSRWIVGE